MTDEEELYNFEDGDDFDGSGDYFGFDLDDPDDIDGGDGFLADGIYGMPNAAGMPTLAYAEATNDRPASERIDVLFEQMGTKRRTLLGILAFCVEAVPANAVYEYIAKLQKHAKSVYTPERLCTMLEEAGALRCVTEDGVAYDEIDLEPRVIEENGVQYMEATEPPEPWWAITDEGLSKLESNQPLERIHELFAENARYVPVYHQVLALAARDGGVGTKEAGTFIDSDPLLQDPKYYATRFIDHLERADAIVWEAAWRITPEGAQALEELDAEYGKRTFLEAK